MTGIDPTTFREAAAQFPTGVTVVTTIDRDGGEVGITVNSFSTVSLDPPLVSFCIGRDSDSFEAFAAGIGFVVHVLGADQRDVSRAFATKGVDKFAGVDWKPGHANLPVIDRALSTFQCSSYAGYDGGDHVIHVGLVERLAPIDTDRPALGYFRHGYFKTTDRNQS